MYGSLINKIISKKNIDPKQALLIFGDPRSGSTWLAESLNQIPRTIFFNEPLDLGTVKRNVDLDIYWRQFVPEHEEWNELKRYLNDVFQLKVNSYEIRYFNSFLNIFQGNIPLLKFVRGKGILPWMLNNFKFEHKPILLIRNPYAIVASMLKHPGWQFSFETFEVPKTRYNDFYLENLDFFQSLDSKEAFFAANVCFANKWVLNHQKCRTTCLIIRYEELLQNFDETINRILSNWNIQDFEIYNSVSSSRRVNTPINISEQLFGWKNILSKEQIRSISRVIDEIKVPDFYEAC